MEMLVLMYSMEWHQWIILDSCLFIYQLVQDIGSCSGTSAYSIHRYPALQVLKSKETDNKLLVVLSREPLPVLTHSLFIFKSIQKFLATFWIYSKLAISHFYLFFHIKVHNSDLRPFTKIKDKAPFISVLGSIPKCNLKVF